MSRVCASRAVAFPFCGRKGDETLLFSLARLQCTPPAFLGTMRENVIACVRWNKRGGGGGGGRSREETCAARTIINGFDSNFLVVCSLRRFSRLLTSRDQKLLLSPSSSFLLFQSIEPRSHSKLRISNFYHPFGGRRNRASNRQRSNRRRGRTIQAASFLVEQFAARALIPARIS